MISIAQMQSLGWMANVTIATALFLGLISAAALSANPRRLSTQVFALHSGISILWLYCVYRGMRAAETSSWNQDIELWGRANSAIVALLPWCLWLLKEAIIDPATDRIKIIFRSLPLLCLACFLAILSYSDSFFIKSPDSIVRRGLPYFIYNIVSIITYMLLFITIIRQIPKTRGIRRIELQFITLVTTVVTTITIALNFLGNITTNRIFNRASITLISIGYAIIVAALTAHRIFKPREILLSFGQKFMVLAFMTAGTLAIAVGLGANKIMSIEFTAAIFTCGACSIWLERNSRRWFRLDDSLIFDNIRARGGNLTRTCSTTEQMLSEIETVLREEWDTENAVLVVDASAQRVQARFNLTFSDKAYTALCDLGYITPESIERRRKTAELEELQSLLSAKKLGILLISSPAAQSPLLAVGLGLRRDESPFTHTDAQCLQRVAELVDNIISHSRLTEHASLQASVEHLALMSRGLAHDLKNLITPVASFIGHTKARSAGDPAEAEVHGAADRSVQVMSEYIRESLFFAERLHLRVDTVNVLALFSGVKEVVAMRARSRNIAIDIEADRRPSIEGDAILLQRMLVNLVGNAIDASAPGDAVLLRVDPGGRDMVSLQVVDHGAGIKPENIDRVFEPYYTTKASGDEARGFGLGLTICQKIVTLHGGRISLSSEPGQGTTVTVELPAPPRSQILPSQACLALG